MDFRVDTDGLRADGAGLANSTGSAPPTAPHCPPPTNDPVSASVAARLTQQSQALWALMEHAGQQRHAGGVSVAAVANYLGLVDDGNAAMIAGVPSGSIAAPSTPGSPSGGTVSAPPPPVIPPVPAMPSPPPLSGEQVSMMVHSGPGPDSLRAFAEQWRTAASQILSVAEQTRSHGNGVEQNWHDGEQQAAKNILAHADWLESSLHAKALKLADAADEAAGHADTVIQNTATPQEFQDVRQRLNTALANYRASGGLNASQVLAVSQELQTKQSTAVVGFQSYAASAPVAANGAGTPPEPAPAILRGAQDSGPNQPKKQPDEPSRHGGGEGKGDSGSGEETDAGSGTDKDSTADGGGRPPRSAAATPTMGAATQQGMESSAPGMVSEIAGQMFGTGAGTVSRLAGGLGGPGSPLSALSSLSSLPGMGGMPEMSPPEMPSGGDGGGGDTPTDYGDTGDYGTGGTSPAGLDAGMGGGGGMGSAPAAVAGSPMGSGVTAGAVPAGPTGGGGPAGGGGGMFGSPMMGGMGQGNNDEGRKATERRRVVHRPMPNTEAVFGEVERRRARRSAPRKEES